MKARVDPDLAVTTVTIGGRRLRPGDTVVVSRDEFNRINRLKRGPFLLDIDPAPRQTEEGADEPPHHEPSVQEDS